MNVTFPLSYYRFWNNYQRSFASSALNLLNSGCNTCGCFSDTYIISQDSVSFITEERNTLNLLVIKVEMASLSIRVHSVNEKRKFCIIRITRTVELSVIGICKSFTLFFSKNSSYITSKKFFSSFLTVIYFSVSDLRLFFFIKSFIPDCRKSDAVNVICYIFP